jgi:hypothetical protein
MYCLMYHAQGEAQSVSALAAATVCITCVMRAVFSFRSSSRSAPVLLATVSLTVQENEHP